MSFFDVVETYESFDFNRYFDAVRDEEIEESLRREKLTSRDLLNFLSPRAQNFLEPMAQKARQLTIQYFGRTIQLYIPLYISNYCTNECVYCGFNRANRIRRKKLTHEEIAAEAEAISRTEMKHILVLTGEARQVTPMDYIEEAIRIIKKRFSSISIEMFPMDTEEYRRLKAAGVDGLTVYQEVYDREIYQKVHPAGNKSDYRYRLDTPERGAQAGIRMINIATLFGLGDQRREAFMAGMHAKYLDDKYLDTELSLSLPRMNAAEGGYTPPYPVDDKSFVQFILAYRLFLPRSGITISTREPAALRDRLMFLGVTRMSAGSRTDVGGYTKPKECSTAQFEINDDRDVADIIQAIRDRGFQPIFKDWELIEE
jgi:2-iminoacetate synthase